MQPLHGCEQELRCELGAGMWRARKIDLPRGAQRGEEEGGHEEGETILGFQEQTINFPT